MYVFKRIDPNSIYITPFKAYKQWTINNSDYTNYGILIYSGTYQDFYYDLNDPSTSDRPITIDNRYEYITHASQHHLYYNNDSNYYHFDTDNRFKKRQLSTHIKAISIPQFIFGESIRPTSVNISLTPHPWDSYFDFSTCSLSDDGYGNLIDNDVKYHLFDNGASLGDELNNIIAKWDFDTLYKNSFVENKLYTQINNVQDLTYRGNNGILYNSRFERVDNLNNVTDGLGTIWNLDTGSYMQVKHSDTFNFHTNDNFGIAILARISSDISEDGYFIIKNGLVISSLQADGTVTKYDKITKSAYPFAIKYVGTGDDAGKIVASRYDGYNTSQVMSTTTYNDDGFHLIVFTKSGSQLLLGVDDTVWSASDASIYRTDNFSELFIGSYGSGTLCMTGSIKSVKIYDDYIDLTTTKITTWSILEKNGLDSYYVGNVINNYGFITLTNQAYYNAFKTSTSWQMSMYSTKTIYEYEIICTANSNEFNISTNPSLRYQDELDTTLKIKDTFTSSYFNPYVSVIGLYNNDGELLAIGKPSSPIKKPKNTSINFILRFDI